MAIPKQGPVIAIDGPAGTGKSSVSNRLAALLGFSYIDTGALYRSIALLAVESGLLIPSAKKNPAGAYELAPSVQENLAELAREAHLEFVRDETRDPSNRVRANGVDVTDRIRTPEISLAGSIVSSVPGVRAALLGLQRRLGCRGKSILEGRDIGTVIFPDADVKFFLTASIKERAKRRLAQMEAQGQDPVSFEEMKEQIRLRDEKDSTRSVAPLKRAQDAIAIDTTEMTFDEVVSKMESLIREKLKP